MQMIHTRDRAGYTELFNTERRYALRLAYVLTGDHDLAEEVVADAFVHMYPQWQRSRIDDPHAYLRRAVINEVNSAFRRREVRRRPVRAERPRVASGADTGVDDRDAVQHALLQLPVRQRAAVALRYLEDLSERETAEALGMSVGSVKSQVSRGLDRLRGILEGDAQ